MNLAAWIENEINKTHFMDPADAIRLILNNFCVLIFEESRKINSFFSFVRFFLRANLI